MSAYICARPHTIGSMSASSRSRALAQNGWPSQDIARRLNNKIVRFKRGSTSYMVCMDLVIDAWRRMSRLTLYVQEEQLAHGSLQNIEDLIFLIAALRVLHVRKRRWDLKRQIAYSLGGGPGASSRDSAGRVNLAVVGKVASDRDPVLGSELDLANTDLARERTGRGQIANIAVRQDGVVDLEGAWVGVDAARVDVLDLVDDERSIELGAIERDDGSFGGRHVCEAKEREAN
jgi:hypothetical protein